MTHINLLPWREERRQRQKKAFVQAFVIALVIAAALVFAGMQFLDGRLAYQDARNVRLSDEIRLLDKAIVEIKELEEQKRQLENRMKVIQDLQRQRPGVVHLFDELVTTLPAGVYLLSMQQKGTTVSIKGKADSNARVSNYMKNMDASPWFGEPKLNIIQAEEIQGLRIQSFELTVPQTQP